MKIKRSGFLALGLSDDRGSGAGEVDDRGSGAISKSDDRGSGADSGPKANLVIDDEVITSNSSDIDLGVLTSVVWDDEPMDD